jgi:phosphatidylinositol alpha-mannosyltransferase
VTRSALRVGLVCPYSFDVPGGVQNHVLGLAHYLRQKGHRPFVLAPGEIGPATARLDVEEFASAGAAVPVRYNGSVARVNFGPVSASRVRRWLRNGNFDVLHIHEPISPSISLLALRAAEQPVVATFHTATPRSRSMQLAGGVLRAAIEKIDACIAVSESARNVVVQHLGRDAVVIPNGIEFASFAGGRQMHDELVGGSPSTSSGHMADGSGHMADGSASPSTSSGHVGDHPKLIFVGRLDEPRKGLDVLLAAVPLIKKIHPDLEVIVAGRGSKQLPDWWHNLGPINEQTKIALLSSADVFVAPNLARESFGIVVLEAMASGVPVVASELPSFVDLIGPAQDDGRLGEVFAAGDHRALAGAVLRVLKQPNPLRAAKAQEVARRYDWSRVGATVLAVYRAALATAPARSNVTTRVDRAEARAERTWAALDAALVQRAQRALELITSPGIDPATALLVTDAAAAALEPNLSRRDRERAESDLSHVLDTFDPLLSSSPERLDLERELATISRRLHNDAVATALSLRRRHTVRMPGIADSAATPRPFEMVDGDFAL